MDDTTRDHLKTLHTAAIDARNGYHEALEDAGGQDKYKGMTPLFRDMVALHQRHAVLHQLRIEYQLHMRLVDATRDLRVRHRGRARLRGDEQEGGDHLLVPRNVHFILKEVFARDKPGTPR